MFSKPLVSVLLAGQRILPIPSRNILRLNHLYGNRGDANLYPLMPFWDAANPSTGQLLQHGTRKRL